MYEIIMYIIAVALIVFAFVFAPISMIFYKLNFRPLEYIIAYAMYVFEMIYKATRLE